MPTLGNLQNTGGYFRKELETDYRVYLYCHDYASTCAKTAGLVAYSWTHTDAEDPDHHTVFCPDFFKKPSLGSEISAQKDEKAGQVLMENFQTNGAQAMYHQTLCYKGTVFGEDLVKDYASGADGSMKLAEQQGTEAAFKNPDSYAMHALSMYVQKVYPGAPVPVPWYKLSNEAKKGLAPPPAHKSTYTVLLEAPNDWHGPNPDAVSNFDSFEPLGPIASMPLPSAAPTTAAPAVNPTDVLPPKFQCYGAIFPTKWTTRDAMNTAINQFCGTAAQQGKQDANTRGISREYAQGLGDGLKISMEWPPSSKIPDKSTYFDNLKKIMDGCDGNDPNNPWNWKHGGEIDMATERYSISPLVQRYLPGTCNVHVWQKVKSAGEYVIRATGTDHGGAVISDQTFSTDIDVANAYYGNFYNVMYLTVKEDGLFPYNEPVHFAIGSQKWSSDDKNCNVGGYTSPVDGRSRDMDCTFKC